MARAPRRQRRLRGTGSLFVRPDGRWEGRWRAPQDGSGLRPWIRTFGRSEPEAAGLLADAIRDYKRGAVSDAKTTVGAYLDTWLPRVAPALKPHSLRAYELACRLWINPRLGTITLGALTGRHVQRMLASVASEHGVRSAGVAHAVLRKALNDARRLDRLVDRNVAGDVTPPKWRRNPPEPWTPERAGDFLRGLRGHRDEALYLFAAMVGLRPAEALGLRWDRLDLEAGRARIDAAIQWPVGGKPYLGRPKSEASRRTVSLPPRLVTVLTKMKVEHDASVERGQAGLNPELVFTEPKSGPTQAHGRARRIDTFNHRFVRRAEALGYPHIRLYDLRRLAATLMIQTSGLEAARRALGHSSIRLAAETYGYEVEGDSRDLAAGVERILEAGQRPDTPSDKYRALLSRDARAREQARKGSKSPQVPAVS